MKSISALPQGGDLGATLSLAHSFVDRARTLAQAKHAHTLMLADIVIIFFLDTLQEMPV